MGRRRILQQLGPLFLGRDRRRCLGHVFRPATTHLLPLLAQGGTVSREEGKSIYPNRGKEGDEEGKNTVPLLSSSHENDGDDDSENTLSITGGIVVGSVARPGSIFYRRKHSASSE